MPDSTTRPRALRPVSPAASLLAWLAWFGCAATGSAQERLPLPGGTGTVTPGADWAVLGADPAVAEPARTLLRWRIDELARERRTEQHLLLHQPGPQPGSVRLVEAYADEAEADPDDLRDPARAAGIAAVLEPHLRDAGFAVEAKPAAPGPFGETALTVPFVLTRGEHTWVFVHHVVPAAGRTLYVETWHRTDDDGGMAAISALLRTVVTHEAPPNVLRMMLFGGLLGAVAGIATARLRQRRAQRRAGA